MRFVIKHEIRGRMRIHVLQNGMSCRQADILHYYLSSQSFVTSVKVQERLMDVTVCYTGSRGDLIEVFRRFRYEQAQVPEEYLKNSGRALQQQYWDKLVN